MSSMQEQLLNMKFGDVAAMAGSHPDLAKAASQVFGGIAEQTTRGNRNNNSEGELDPQGGVPTMLTANQIKARNQINELATKEGMAPPYKDDVAMTSEQVMARILEAAQEKGFEKEALQLLGDQTGVIAGAFGSKRVFKTIMAETLQFALKLGLVVAAVGAGLWVIKKIVGDTVVAMPEMAQ